jgi:hypothetical protein
MKAHDVADALKALAKLLKSGPNIEIRDLSDIGLSHRYERPIHPPKLNDDLPLALSALLSLSRIDKGEWLSLINDLGLKIDLRPRDASRDIMGKVLRLLESEPEARDLLMKKVKNRQSHASPELARALSSLLNG